jgi:tetratricopeptide (TPR) repeat protein
MPMTMTDSQPAFQRAVLLHGQGRVREAEELYESVLRSDSRHFESIYYLGTIRLQQSRFLDAEVLFRRALKINKRSADARHYLGIALTGLGHFDEAVSQYQKTLDLNPRDAVVLNNLGYVLQKLDRHAEATRHFRKALSINPNYPEAHNNLGNALQVLRRVEEAIEHYQQALALRPNDAGAHNNLASALAARNRHEEAIKHCERALALAPGNPEVHLNLAHSLRAIDRPQDALEHYQKAISIVEAYAGIALTLLFLGRVEEAIAQCEEALTINPNNVEVLQSLGIVLRAIGRVDEAIHAFEKAIAAAPTKAGKAALYYDLVGSKRISASDPHFVAMRQLAGEMKSFQVESQIGLHFALGKAHADIGDCRKSFEHLLEGNALKRHEFIEHDETKILRLFERIRTVFTAELLAEKKGVGDPSTQPVFIIGMPRSGTSLVEQILASHPKVFGAGERAEFGGLANGLVGPDGAKFPEVVVSMSAEQVRSLGTSYVRAMQALAPTVERITDKMPNNFFHAGLIQLALPNARIIHIRRDPRDTALSCFSNLFAMGNVHTYDLAELGRYIRAYEKLMEHWRQVLPENAMIEVQYEELVGNLEGQARRIVDYCGLEWNDACLSFHKNNRPVRTASVMQVRQPIYSSSVGRWRLYEKELEPFLKALSGNSSQRAGVH